MSKNKKIIIGIVIAALTICFIVIGVLKNSGSTVFGEGNAIALKTVKIEKGEISSYISANGTIKEVEKADIFFDTPMRVKKLFVQKNQKVVKGQKLVELDTDSLASDLDKLKVNKKIQELAVNSDVSEAEVERAGTSLKSSESAYNDSKKAYEKNKVLFASNAIAKNELDASLKAYNDAKSALKLAQIALETARDNESVNRQTAVENLKATNISISDMEKKIDAVNKAMTSPIDGVIADTSLEEGAYTSTVQPAFNIINPDKLQVKANVREYDIKYVAVGQTVKITGDAIDTENQITGRVSSISPVATVNQTASGQETVIEVIIDLDTVKGLKPGLSVNCDIATVDRKDVLVAPMEVFTEDKDGNKKVFVVDTKNNTMAEKPVKLGISSDMNVEIAEGLKEGDVVVLDPQPAYKTGDKVKITDSSSK